MREALYWLIGAPVMVVYAFVCAIFIMIATVPCSLVYWNLNLQQKQYIWSIEKHLMGLIDDGGNLIDSIIQGMFLK